jgi:enoyl-CoA hydratase
VVRSQALQRAIAGGETFTPEAAQEAGLVDDLVDGEQLLDRAGALAADLATIGAAAYAVTKAMLQQPLRRRIARQVEAHGARVDQLWADPATLAAVTDYIARTLRK